MEPDFSVSAGNRVFLLASASDADGSIVGVQWRQISGATVTLDDACSLTPSFQTPAQGGTLVFELTVTDEVGDHEPYRIWSFADERGL